MIVIFEFQNHSLDVQVMRVQSGNLHTLSDHIDPSIVLNIESRMMSIFGGHSPISL